LPLILLAIPSLLVGFFTARPMLFGGWFGGAIKVNEANDVLGELGHEFQGAASAMLKGFTTLPFGLVVLAFAITTYIYLFNPSIADRVRRALNPVYQLLNHKYWFDAVYYIVFARGGIALGRMFWKGGDAAVIDGVLIDGSAGLVQRIASGARRLQSGYLYHYAFAMILGLILLLGGYWLAGH
jgi:NADH-quinone oxidoreductase subunit L